MHRFGKATLSVNASLADVFVVLDGERRRRILPGRPCLILIVFTNVFVLSC